ncbi:hypothetical protein ACIA8C_04190 [Nocardia sp. NPDC051321]|uniref:hypothetical protein n=1 Tax=Nocardia sp. NPDC051321 TaxID=3364323 RepID=UPI00379BC58C
MVSPPDLIGLKDWIYRASSDFEERVAQHSGLTWRERRRFRNEVESLRRTCDGSSHGRAENAVRQLLAAGAARYRAVSSSNQSGGTPEHAVLDFAVFAIWPVVIAPDLHEDWFEAIAKLTSPDIAKLVVHCRLYRISGNPMSPSELLAALSKIRFSSGIVNLMDDLSNPNRGGGALTALAIATEVELPPADRSGKKLAAWVFGGVSAVVGAAGAGVIGNRADAAALDLWDWLIHDSANDGSSGSGSSDFDPFGSDVHGASSNAAGNHGGSLVAMIESIFN